MANKIEKYMELALQLSLKAKGWTSPNPLVGAVVVKNNRFISTGFHKRAGAGHAESTALRKAGKRARGATLYVTLEPCSTFGRTPPCTDAIIKSGIKKVIIGMRDPNPKHDGKGMTILRKKGIEVACGVLGDKIRAINQPFIKYITKKMPYITLKIAQSLDGKIATKTGDSQWITSQAARKFAHKIRSNFDAIMVGINTVLRDNPRLDPTQKTKKFYKVVLDTNLKINPALRIFSGVSNSSVVIATSKESLIKKAKRVKDLVNRGAILLGIKKDSALLDIKDMLSKLAQLEITNILVEGGGRVAGSLLDKKLIDEVLFFVSPKIIGGSESISSIQGRGIEKISQAKELKDVKIKKIGEEVLVQGLLNKY